MSNDQTRRNFVSVAGITAATLATTALLRPASAQTATAVPKVEYAIKKLPFDPAKIKGISEKLLVTAQLAGLDVAAAPVFVLNGLKREELIATNSMIIHELYFDGLGGEGDPKGALAEQMKKDFGSVERWKAEFSAVGKALGGGSGWVMLSYSPRDKRLVNTWAADHTMTLANGRPILALDMYEHAYHLDFGANATAYVATFMRNIEWNAVQGRYEDATQVAPPRPLVQKQFADVPAITVEEVAAMLKAGTPVQIIDARPRHYTTKSQDIMEGAVWRDPERLDEWIGELSKTEPVVTYCVYGFHIGCETAVTLRKAGFDARYMAGGHYAWKAIKGPVKLLAPEA